MTSHRAVFPATCSAAATPSISAAPTIYVGLHGSANAGADTVNGDVATDNVYLIDNTTAAVNGSGGAIVVYGTGDTLTASNETIHTIDNATGETIIGSGDAIYTGIGFHGNVDGGSDTVTLAGTGNMLGLYGNVSQIP